MLCPLLRACFAVVEPSWSEASKQASKLKVRQDIGDEATTSSYRQTLLFSFNRSCACMAVRLHHTRMRAGREVVVPRVLLPLQLMSAGRRVYSLYGCAHGRGTRLGWSGIVSQSGLRLTRPLRMMMMLLLLRAVAWSSEAMRHWTGWPIPACVHAGTFARDI